MLPRVILTGTLGGFPHPPAPRLRRAKLGFVAAFLIGLCSALIVGVLAGLSACSSSSGLRDINYGTDVAVGFIAPDGGGSASDAATDVSAGEASSGDDTVADDAVGSPDDGGAADVSVDDGD